MFHLRLWLPRPSLVRGVARIGRASPRRISYCLPRSYSGSPWWKGAAGRSYSWLLQQWQALRKTVGVSPIPRVPRPSPPAPLLLLGVVAFVWDRERITTDEIVSCLQEYETVVESRLQRPPLRSPQPETDRYEPTATSARTTQPETHDEGANHDQQTPEQEPSLRLSRREEERELRRQQFIREARSVYEQHSQDTLSKLPLVGLKQENRLYEKSAKVADVSRGLRVLAVEQTSRLSLVRYLSRSLTDASLQVAIYGESTSFASDSSAVGGTCDVKPEDFGRHVTTDIPLVGMKPRSDAPSKLLEGFFKAARKFCRSVSDSHSHVMVVDAFDNILGVDNLALRQATLSSRPRATSSRTGTGTTEEIIESRKASDAIDSRSKLYVDSLCTQVHEDNESDYEQILQGTALATQPQSDVDQLLVESATILAVAEPRDVTPTLASPAVATPAPATPALATPDEVTPDARLGVSSGRAGPVSREVDHQLLVAKGDDCCEAEEKGDSLAGWELVTKQGGCTAYRKPFKDTGLFQYKVIGTFDDITAKDFLDVQVEYEARKSWDNYMVKMDVVDSDPSSGSEVIHWIFKYPFPMSSREYVFVRRSWVSANEDSIVLINRSVEHPEIQGGRRYIRVRDYYSTMVIRSHTFIDELGLDYELTYFDDPQISLPHSCINWITTTAMPDFMAKVHSAAWNRGPRNQRKQMEGL